MTSNQPPPVTLDDLRGQFPAWTFETHWHTAASGSDRRQIVARRGRLTLSAWAEAAMAQAIREHESGQR